MSFTLDKQTNTQIYKQTASKVLPMLTDRVSVGNFVVSQRNKNVYSPQENSVHDSVSK